MTDSHSLYWKFVRELTRLLGEDLKQVNHATLLDCFGNAESQLGCDPTYQVYSMMKTNGTPRQTTRLILRFGLASATINNSKVGRKKPLPSSI
jgi:hypothetical protein